MTAYVISYDLRKARNYDGLINALRTMGCISPLKSMWFGNLVGPVGEIRRLLLNEMDADDGLVIIELKPGANWATRMPNENGGDWLSNNVTAQNT